MQSDAGAIFRLVKLGRKLCGHTEILANFLVLSEVRKIIKKTKKKFKVFDDQLSKKILKNFSHNLTLLNLLLSENYQYCFDNNYLLMYHGQLYLDASVLKIALYSPGNFFHAF